MNWKRILIGGLVAGVVIDFLEGFLSNFIIGLQAQNEMPPTRGPLEPTAPMIAFFIGWGFIVGIISVFLYAAARPRLGAGPRTALIVAVCVWTVHGLLPHMKDAVLGIFSMNLCLKYALISLIWCISATILGAWIYRETPAGVATTA